MQNHVDGTISITVNGEHKRVPAGLTIAALAESLGLVPAIVLIARRDYRALAAISCAMGIAVLSATAVLAARGDIAGVCVTYAVYHAVAAAALWWRAARIEPGFANPLAIRGHVANGAAIQSARPDAP